MPNLFRKRGPAGQGIGGTPFDHALDALLTATLSLPAFIAILLVFSLLGGNAKAEGTLEDATETSAASPSCGARSLLPDLERSGALASMETAAAIVPNGEGKLFRIEKDGLAPSYLFGTMHMSDPRILALPAETQGALDASRRLVIETTDMLDEAKMSALVFTRPDLLNLPDGKVLKDVLTPAQMAEADRLLAADGIPLQSVERLQPWFVAIGLLFPACEASRMEAGEKPLDLRLALDAEEDGKEVLGLETGAEQLEVIASLPMDIQISSLIATLALKDTLPDIFETMTELYLSGRIAMITPLSEAVMPLGLVSEESRKGYAAFEKRIVTDRNHTMARRLGSILSKGETFVAVGALHLPGAEGLVELLRAYGFRLTRLD
ncbi:MAG: TraB/GumN family protein [Rhizobiaceae bacterium]|nr:TraB/GumN family protein [Rhizobiaceae bacterium]